MNFLHLEDEFNDAILVRDLIAREFPGSVVTHVDNEERFRAGLLPGSEPDLILADFSVPGYSGLAALALVQERGLRIPFIFLSGTIGEERAIAALRAGATDYVQKGNLARLPVAIRRALDDFARNRRRDEDECRLRELTDIIQRATEAIVVSDLSGRITLWNDGAARLYGLSAGETVGRTSDEVFSGTELAHVRDARETTLETGDWRRELSVTTRDGRLIVADVHMTLVRDAAGRPSARLTIATDITEKKRLEEKLLRTQRLESLGLLAAGIAHDFNNILAPIVMTTSLLRHRADDPDEIRMLDVVKNCTIRGSGLVRQILGFARGVGGKLQFTRPSPLLREIGDVIRTSFPSAIVFNEDIPDNLWPIQANPIQIHRVLMNLASNARDAMLPRGGTLRLSAENRTLDELTAPAFEGARPGRYLVIEVSDTGIGIKPEALAHIWEPFFTTKGENGGTGLGLSTVRGIAAAHGGFVTVETKVGLGTAFRVFLPAAKSVEA